MILSFWTDGPGQTVQTQSSLIRVCTICHSVCIVWTHYSMLEPHSSNFRVILTNFLGVRIFRKFTVKTESQNTVIIHGENYQYTVPYSVNFVTNLDQHLQIQVFFLKWKQFPLPFSTLIFCICILYQYIA